MLVGTGFLLLWIWTHSPRNKGSIPFVRKRRNPAFEKNTIVMESTKREISVLFGAGSSRLEKESMDLLRSHCTPEILSQIGYFTLIGSADASGHLSKNRRLVKERVRIVESYLVSLGISKDKIRKFFLDPSYGGSPELRKRLRSVTIHYAIET
ncbi:OmpA family protein [Leptospira sp. 201903074]|nr:OmpA family protein [Leptospira abararensis]